ncbi:ribosome biogenesis GTPase Der [Flavobacteriaceae bacterium]|jgi:GTP-binding protein|nr:ribosome biogenesis GTPase Der [Flavobacteriaceae bacterium]|tara:strand:- start:437 stop:1741 length:1305 start_codon:yes stop_codon:yes gene_type:complete
MSSIVAIVGRPNVGKSTLFNRLIQKREAIVDSQSGVTRDRHYGFSYWNGKDFTVIDTGGYMLGGDDNYEKEINGQVMIAIEESDVIIFAVDVESGLNSTDSEIARLLHKSNKDVIVAINKVDNYERQLDSNEFHSLGFKKIFNISAINGSGSGELLDELVSFFPDESSIKVEDIPGFAVVGRPNAGKSSFINALLGIDRYVVKDEPGTTRDSIDTHFNRFGFDFKLIDTAGIRRKSKISDDVEFYSVVRSIRTIENSDVCLIIFDASRSFDAQVKNIFWLAARNNKGIVILVNKWDLVDKKTNTIKLFEEQIRKELEPFVDVPIVFMSTLTKQRIFKAIETGMAVYKNRKTLIVTRKFNEAMLPVIERNPPPAYKGKYVKIKFCTQLPSPYPQFAFFCNLPQYVKDPYKRYLENQIREIYDFNGVPINIFFRKK